MNLAVLTFLYFPSLPCPNHLPHPIISYPSTTLILPSLPNITIFLFSPFFPLSLALLICVPEYAGRGSWGTSPASKEKLNAFSTGGDKEGILGGEGEEA